jgi:GNAT superfamily N-acetyltransferase
LVSDDSVGVAGIPADVVFLALNPIAAGPEPAPETGAVRVINARYCLFMTPMPTVNFVERVRLAPGQVAAAVSEVRDLLRARGRTQAAWSVDSASAELYDELAGLAMTPYTDPPLEPRCTCMALVQPPDWSANPRVVVREATELHEFLAVAELSASVFGISEADRDGFMNGLRVRYELHRQGRSHMSTYLAFIDGELVGEAQAAVTASGTNLSGSSVLRSARGQGVYRALVAARWNEAVGRGRPALTVQAGAMSRPILERLGFQTVGTQLLLCDRFQ